MTKRLILMRHCKSDWSFDLEDHDRPLNPRGLRSAEALGQWLRLNDTLPDQILCSSAVRTRETCEWLGLTVAPELRADLYLADPDAMLAALRQASGDTVLMIGHNPGIGWMAHLLATQPPVHERFDDYPTGATLVAEFPITDWGDLSPGSGEVVDFITPRELI